MTIAGSARALICSQSRAAAAAIAPRTTSTFSCDIPYSRSPRRASNSGLLHGLDVLTHLLDRLLPLCRRAELERLDVLQGLVDVSGSQVVRLARRHHVLASVRVGRLEPSLEQIAPGGGLTGVVR